MDRNNPGGGAEERGEEVRASGPHVVFDPLSGREVIFAPGRAKRPGSYGAQLGAGTPDKAETCPFCEGHERDTPPELFALGGSDDREPDAPGWKVRVVPNLFPAVECQQVVIHAPAHASSLGEISDDQLELVAEAWAEVAERAWAQGFDHLFAFVNEGTSAGASLRHSHSQLVWLKQPPAEVATEAPQLQRDHCALCALLGGLDPSLKLAERELGEGTVSLAVSPSGRAPYELLIAPNEHLPDSFGGTTLLAAALELAAEGARRLSAVEGPSPFNLWLHNFQDDGHWHLELVPRLSFFSGLELGAGVFINTLLPGEAAARLRGALP